jgi:hypothetical protein
MPAANSEIQNPERDFARSRMLRISWPISFELFTGSRTASSVASLPALRRLRFLLLAGGIVAKQVGELFLAVRVAPREGRETSRQPGTRGRVGRFRRLGQGCGENGRRWFGVRALPGRIGNRREWLVGEQEGRLRENGSFRLGRTRASRRELERNVRFGLPLGAREGSLQGFPDAGRPVAGHGSIVTALAR